MIVSLDASDNVWETASAKTRDIMDSSFIRYSYLESDLPDEWLFYPAYLEYILDDGSRLGVAQEDYFCRACNRFVAGERIESVAELEFLLEQIENNPESRHRKFAEYIGDLPKQISDLQARINWRKKRQSPPKCLHCGSTDILPVPEDEEFDHPATGLRMKAAGQGFASTDQWHATYTPEGDSIESTGGSTREFRTIRGAR